VSVPSITIADSIVTALNAAELSIDFTATREYVPRFEAENAAIVQVQVVPKQDSREIGSAANDNATIDIDIGVMKKLQDAVTDEKAEMDALLELCEEIKAVINRERLAGATDSICIGLAQAIPYDVEKFEDRIFLTVITATFATTVAI
jgi:hypothetical protein